MLHHYVKYVVCSTRIFFHILDLGRIFALIPREWLVESSKKPIVPSYSYEVQLQDQARAYLQWLALRSDK